MYCMYTNGSMLLRTQLSFEQFSQTKLFLEHYSPAKDCIFNSHVMFVSPNRNILNNLVVFWLYYVGNWYDHKT